MSGHLVVWILHEYCDQLPEIYAVQIFFVIGKRGSSVVWTKLSLFCSKVLEDMLGECDRRLNPLLGSRLVSNSSLCLYDRRDLVDLRFGWRGS